MQLKKVKVSQLRPNRYRNMEEYPLHPEKLDVIERSMRDTGFWSNIVCRVDGRCFEIAYGHHRLEVLRTRSKLSTVSILVDELSNEKMLKMMSRENHEAFGTDAWVEMEDIRQTIDAYDRGEIELPEIDERGKGAREEYVSPTSEKHFTKLQIARFLDRTKQEGKEADYGFEKAWKALYLVENSILSTSQFRGLTREEMAVVAGRAETTKNSFDREAKAAKKRAKKATTPAARKRAERQAEKYERQGKAEAKKVAAAAEKVIRNGGGVREARKVTGATPVPVPKTIDVNGLADHICKGLAKILDSKSGLNEQLKLLRENKRDASDKKLQAVCNEIDKLAKRVGKVRTSLCPNK